MFAQVRSVNLFSHGKILKWQYDCVGTHEICSLFTWVLDCRGSLHIFTCCLREKLIYKMTSDSQNSISFANFASFLVWLVWGEVKCGWSHARECSPHWWLASSLIPPRMVEIMGGANCEMFSSNDQTDLASDWTQVCINLSLIDGNKRWIEAAQCLSLCECVIWMLTAHQVNGLCDTVFPWAGMLISREKNSAFSTCIKLN